MSWLTDIFSNTFMLRALIVGVMIAICSALIGVLLVLRKNSMVGDGLSHVAFGAFAVAIVLGIAPLWFAIPAVIVASFFVLRIGKNRKLHGDAAIALLSASSLAIGIFAISISKGVNIDLNSYLFGSILSVGWLDVWISVGLAIAVILLYFFTHHRIFAITFDEEFAKSIGIKTGLYDTLFAIICSVVVVLGMKLLGALLISSLIIFPAVIAMQFAKSFRKVVVISVIVSIINFALGLLISFILATPTGATIVIMNLIGLLVAKILK